MHHYTVNIIITLIKLINHYVCLLKTFCLRCVSWVLHGWLLWDPYSHGPLDYVPWEHLFGQSSICNEPVHLLWVFCFKFVAMFDYWIEIIQPSDRQLLLSSLVAIVDAAAGISLHRLILLRIRSSIIAAITRGDSRSDAAAGISLRRLIVAYSHSRTYFVFCRDTIDHKRLPKSMQPPAYLFAG